VPNVLRRPGVWLFCGVNLLVFGLYRSGYLRDKRWSMDSEDVKIITAVTSFFEVFYTNQCYTRYLRFWNLNKKMCGKIYDFAFLARLITRSSAKPYDRVASRWLAVAHLLFLSRDSDADGQCWRKLLSLDLVNQDEVAFLSSLTAHQRLLVLLHAVGDLIRTGLEDIKAPVNLLPHLMTCLLDYRNLQQEVDDLLRFPMPYQYFHLVNLMITVNLAIWAYSMGLSMSIFSPIFFFFAALIFLGMMDLASQLADPFGDDDADFPLHYWTTDFLHNLSALLEYEHAGAADNFKDDLEEEASREKSIPHLELAEVESVLYNCPLPGRECDRKHALLAQRGPSSNSSSVRMLVRVSL